ncbi:MAG: hypothetical protein KAS49_05670 [Candidatus Cloacimonetes bacterium]|nr:hypothetical protein [Candidatus Cloacimonadota bacterium]
MKLWLSKSLKLKHRISKWLSIILSAIIFLFANYINILPNHFHSIFEKSHLLLSSDYDIKPLLYTMWQIQALISSLTIMIFAILQSVFDKRIYGMRLIEALNLKHYYASFITTSIMLIGVMYWFVAKEMLAGAVFVFSINIGIIIYLFYHSMLIITKPEKLEKNIANYIETEILNFVTSENGENHES